MKTRKIIYADDGKVLTDGNTYGKVIFLADNANVSDFYEIPEEEYNYIMQEQENINSINKYN